MKKPPNDADAHKSKSVVLLEHILLIVCLCVLALRTTFTESPTIQIQMLSINLGDTVYSLSISAVLILSLILWLVWVCCTGRFIYRISGIEVGLCVFILAALISGTGASDKRMAISHFVVTLAPALCAILLVQILNSTDKIRVVLVVVVALGIVCAYQCTEQLLASNQMTIEQYEQAPETILGPLGIEKGSLQQFLFEHRLYSRGVRGYFTTSNSAGSFLLLASFAAIILFMDRWNNRKSTPSVYLLASGTLTVIVIFSLALTRSKGAILGFLFALATFVAYSRYAAWLKAYRKTLLVTSLSLVIMIASAVIWFGLKYGRLPGGNSMLVRGQYWRASIQMFADHPLKGVGPGNFGYFYPRYKPPEAIESVVDPHCFPLSILTQYSLIGLVGFLSMLFVPLWKTTRTFAPAPSSNSSQAQSNFKIGKITLLLIVSVALLLNRLISMPMPFATDPVAAVYVAVTLNIIPVAIFIISFLLLIAPLRTPRNTANMVSEKIVSVAIFCAILGVLFHSLIDFAIFEPGVSTTLWVLLACLIAIVSGRNPRTSLVLKIPPLLSVLLAVAGLILALAYICYAFIPVIGSTAKIRQARQAVLIGQFEQAHILLAEAANADRLCPAASSLNGQLYLQQYYQTTQTEPDLLEKAKQSLQTAIRRNQADFKNYEKLSTIYLLLDESQKAFETCLEAVDRYPGCGRLHFMLAQIAEQLGRNEFALQQYEKTIQIEDSYRRQFRTMYPLREDTISRLGDDKYKLAKEKIKDLIQ